METNGNPSEFDLGEVESTPAGVACSGSLVVT